MKIRENGGVAEREAGREIEIGKREDERMESKTEGAAFFFFVDEVFRKLIQKAVYKHLFVYQS